MSGEHLSISNKPVILITGKNGQVGWELQRSLASIGHIVAYGRETMDLSSSDSIRAALEMVKPDIIVNAAAYTAVDKAESDEAMAFAINAEAPRLLAEFAKRNNSLLIHYSTDYVFSGEKDSPYVEEDNPGPLNVYGSSKLKGEQALEESGADYVILRTSWVYASRGHNFLLSMVRLAKEREELRIVDDQVGSPTSSRLIADVTAHVVHQSMERRGERDFNSGLYHLTSRGAVSWCGFAKKIIEDSKLILSESEILTKMITPITTNDYPTPATRPANSRLVTDKLEREFKLHMPDWSSQVSLCVNDLK